MTVAKTRPTALNRIRDNQRRSRARRKDYMEELEKRVQTFERLGVQAGVELQTAARKVARENYLLRTLLGHHGVTSTEIETYLRGTDDDPRAVSSASPSQAGTTSTLHQHLLSGTAGHFPALERKALVEAQLEHRHRPTPTVAASDSSNTPPPPAMLNPIPQSSRCKVSHPSTFSQSPLPSSSFERGGKYDGSGRKAQVGKMDDATSCETAAWIIASLRGHDNAEEVRAELGCSSNEDCTVENMKIFNAMDR
ncbi:MAG: hypothetical protein Q9225_005851 [Loekoesia sp. 1 TL-2023]